MSESAHVTKSGETKNLWIWKPVLISKVVNPFTRALTPPFIGRWRDFYIPRIPSNLENIPSVNTYMNVFYIPWFAGLLSYMYMSATIHTFNPDFWSNVFDLASSWPPKLLSWKSPLIMVAELRLHQIPELRRFLIHWTLPVFNHPEMDSRFTNRSLIPLLFSRIIRRLAKCTRFIKISSRMFPSQEIRLSTPKTNHEFIHEFGELDVPRV
jgi:hypothetical protein